MLTSPLNIAVVGAGNIGSTFAFQLAAAGHAVTVVARPGSTRLQQLQRDGAIVRADGTRAPVSVSDQLDPVIPYDVVIVTVTVHQVDAVVPALRDSAAAHIVCMFNQFEPGSLRDRIGAARCDFGMPFVQASLDADGKLHAVIGAGGQKTKFGAQCWVDLFAAAGLPATFEPDMPRWLRCHVPLCVAFESIAVAGVRRDGGASWRDASTIARGVKQSFALIEALGDPLYPAGKARLYASPWWVTAAILWSVSRITSFRTLLAQGEPECGTLVDIMVNAAQQAGAPVDTVKIAAMKPAR
jgi:2-dehydropantoate 2-reductase